MDKIISNIQGLSFTPLKIICNEKGNVMHALKKSELSFMSFGEAYFSFINHKEVKGWKKHSKMNLNIIVPEGNIRFVFFDDRGIQASQRNFFSVIIGSNNYQRITVPPNIWMAFQGIDKGANLLLNIADIEHDPNESESLDIKSFSFNWDI